MMSKAGYQGGRPGQLRGVKMKKNKTKNPKKTPDTAEGPTANARVWLKYESLPS